jgi:hypothetical protein
MFEDNWASGSNYPSRQNPTEVSCIPFSNLGVVDPGLMGRRYTKEKKKKGIRRFLPLPIGLSQTLDFVGSELPWIKPSQRWLVGQCC